MPKSLWYGWSGSDDWIAKRRRDGIQWHYKPTGEDFIVVVAYKNGRTIFVKEPKGETPQLVAVVNNFSTMTGRVGPLEIVTSMIANEDKIAFLYEAHRPEHTKDSDGNPRTLFWPYYKGVVLQDGVIVKEAKFNKPGRSPSECAAGNWRYENVFSGKRGENTDFLAMGIHSDHGWDWLRLVDINLDATTFGSSDDESGRMIKPGVVDIDGKNLLPRLHSGRRKPSLRLAFYDGEGKAHYSIDLQQVFNGNLSYASDVSYNNGQLHIKGNLTRPEGITDADLFLDDTGLLEKLEVEETIPLQASQ